MPNKHVLIAIATLALVAAAAAVPRPSAGAARAPERVAAVKTAFLPSKHGFAFRNPKPKPKASSFARLTSGRCGGMTYGAIDHFRKNVVPANDRATDDYLLQRSADSIVSNGAKFVLWSVWPKGSNSFGTIGALTRREELPRLAEQLEKGPVPLGLVRAKGISDIRRNHQVVAYALRMKGDVAIVSVYDSCQPGADDVTLEFDVTDTDGTITEYAGDWVVAEWRGLFVEHYVPASPPKQ